VHRGGSSKRRVNSLTFPEIRLTAFPGDQISVRFSLPGDGRFAKQAQIVGWLRLRNPF
jgi:hypothetical protein